MELPPLSHAAQETMSGAAAECGRRRHYYLGVEHVAASLARSAGSPLGAAMTRQGLSVPSVVSEWLEQAPVYPQRLWGNEVLITPRCQKVLRIAARLAEQASSSEVEVAHLLEAVLQEARSTPLRHMVSMGVDIAALHQTVIPAPSQVPAHAGATALARYGRDLTARAR